VKAIFKRMLDVEARAKVLLPPPLPPQPLVEPDPVRIAAILNILHQAGAIDFEPDANALIALLQKQRHEAETYRAAAPEAT
jgi:hypothetical protein